MKTTSISIDDTVHNKIIEKQTEVLKIKKRKPKMLELNNYIVIKGLVNFDIDEFMTESEI